MSLNQISRIINNKDQQKLSQFMNIY